MSKRFPIYVRHEVKIDKQPYLDRIIKGEDLTKVVVEYCLAKIIPIHLQFILIVQHLELREFSAKEYEKHARYGVNSFTWKGQLIIKDRLSIEDGYDVLMNPKHEMQP